MSSQNILIILILLLQVPLLLCVLVLLVPPILLLVILPWLVRVITFGMEEKWAMAGHKTSHLAMTMCSVFTHQLNAVVTVMVAEVVTTALVIVKLVLRMLEAKHALIAATVALTLVWTASTVGVELLVPANVHQQSQLMEPPTTSPTLMDAFHTVIILSLRKLALDLMSFAARLLSMILTTAQLVLVLLTVMPKEPVAVLRHFSLSIILRLRDVIVDILTLWVLWWILSDVYSFILLWHYRRTYAINQLGNIVRVV